MASEVRIDRLEDALNRLAQAQVHTEKRMGPEVQTRLQELSIPLLFSYGRFAT